MYVPVKKEVIDLTTSDPTAEILAAMEEFTALSRGVSFIDESTPLPAAPGAIQRHCTKVQQTKRKVPNAVNAETHQVEPAKAKGKETQKVKPQETGESAKTKTLKRRCLAVFIDLATF